MPIKRRMISNVNMSMDKTYNNINSDKTYRPKKYKYFADLFNKIKKICELFMIFRKLLKKSSWFKKLFTV